MSVFLYKKAIKIESNFVKEKKKEEEEHDDDDDEKMKWTHSYEHAYKDTKQMCIDCF